MTRKVDVQTYLNYLLQYLNKDDLKQVCREFKIKDVSILKKSELIDFILNSLTEEEMEDLLEQKELEIISDGIKIAINKIHENDPEAIIEIKIINLDENKIEILFRGLSWETTSFLSITCDNINNPERGCDCRAGLNKGFCNHFWIGFIFSLKQDYFKLSDWSLTPLPEGFEEKIKSIKIAYYRQQPLDEDSAFKQISLIDESYDGFQLNKNTRITIYEGEITEIVEKQSLERAQFHDLYSDDYLESLRKKGDLYYMVLLKNIKIGPRKSDFQDEIKDMDALKVRISERLITDNKLKIKDKIKFSGRLSKDYFWGYMVKRVKKIEKLFVDSRGRIIHFKSENEKVERRESEKCTEFENKLIEFVKSDNEVKISFIAEYFFPAPLLYQKYLGREYSQHFQFLYPGKFSQTKKIVDSALKLIEETLNNLIERKIIRGAIKAYQDRSGLYYIDEKKIYEEEIWNIYNTLQKFSGKYARIHIKELVNEIKLSELKVIEIVEMFIQNKIIPATYDPNSKGIEFNVIEEDIKNVFQKINKTKIKKILDEKTKKK